MAQQQSFASEKAYLAELRRFDGGVASEVKVDADGYIEFGSRSLTQAEAMDVAAALAQAVFDSQYRNQSAEYISRWGVETKLYKLIRELRGFFH